MNQQVFRIRKPDGGEIEPDQLDWTKRPDGLMPAIIQDATTKRVLMEGYMSPDTLRETLQVGRVVFQSRTRGRWMKGETSGDFLNVDADPSALRTDCDRDALLILVNPVGNTCHVGAVSCFGQNDPASVSDLAVLMRLNQVIVSRANDAPETSYTAKLLQGDVAKVAKKIGEEGVELAIALVSESPERIASECADLVYHLLVGLRKAGVELTAVTAELERREGKPPRPSSLVPLPR